MIKPFSLDLGAASVTVESADPTMDEQGCSSARHGKILLSADQEGQQLLITLWHEIWHLMDEMMLGKQIETKFRKQEEAFIDQLAHASHLVLRRNWPFWAEIYGALAKGKRR